MPKNPFLKELGNFGEGLAAQFLVKKGYCLVQRNYLIRGGQIDLIMYSPQGNLVFVEVKTRQSNDPRPPARQYQAIPALYREFSLSYGQLRCIRRAASHFLTANAFPFVTWQLDLIWINLDRQASPQPLAKIKHYQNILDL